MLPSYERATFFIYSYVTLQNGIMNGFYIKAYYAKGS